MDEWATCPTQKYKYVVINIYTGKHVTKKGTDNKRPMTHIGNKNIHRNRPIAYKYR
tara:strand:+ start:506 stop:673 length:168 start_codon:yes stop_codon:yes gene_type:complete